MWKPIEIVNHFLKNVETNWNCKPFFCLFHVFCKKWKPSGKWKPEFTINVETNWNCKPLFYVFSTFFVKSGNLQASGNQSLLLMWKPIEIVNHFSVFSTFFVKSGNLQVSGNQNILKSGNIANKNMVYKIVSTSAV